MRGLSEGGGGRGLAGCGKCPGCGGVGPYFREFPATSCVFVFLLLAFVIEIVLESGMAFI